jgi:predicted ATP-dependent endonuclease of OLD family
MEKYTIHKKVACITDLDPVRKENTEKASFEKCYPFELDLEKDNYTYKSCSNDLVDIFTIDITGKSKHENIVCFSQEKGQGKTFEYALAYTNPNCKLILTESISNFKELNDLFELYKQDKSFERMIGLLGKRGQENPRIAENIQRYKGLDNCEHLIASRYLNSIQKGENAYELAKALEENLHKKNSAKFKVPNYIKEAIAWVCR